jgi:hypothetical protein
MQKELQKQMMLYAYILKETQLHRIYNQSEIKDLQVKLSFDPTVDYNHYQCGMFDELHEIFSTEISISSIVNQVYKFAEKQMTSVLPTFLKLIAAKILFIIGKLYD